VALALSLFRLARADAGDERTVELPELVVPLPRAEAEADPTASATIVDAARFEGEAKGVGELVATSPGVAISDYGGLGQLSSVSIRGSSSDAVTVFLDGLPLNTAAGGGVDLSSIPRQWVSRIEVVRGAEGAHYGAGAMGGVVNVITRPVAAGAWSAEATGGSFLTVSASGDAGIGGERWGAMAAAAFDATEGRFPYVYGGQETVRDNDAARRGGLLLKAWTQVGEGRLDGLGQISMGWRELPGPASHPTPNDLQEDGRAALAVRCAGPVATGVLLSAGLWGRQDLLDVRLESLGGGTDRQSDLAGGGQAELTWAHGVGTLTAAASASGERLSADGLGGPRSRADLAAWAAEELRLLSGSLRLAPAVRAESVGPFAGLSWKAGAAWTIAPTLSVRASGGQTFRAPSLAELYLEQGLLAPNPELRPEQAWTADVSLVAEGAAGFASATVFGSLYRDLVVYEAGSFGRLVPRNDGKALVRGLEVEAASAPAPSLLGLRASLAYTFLATETLRGGPGELGKELPHRPRNRFYARLAVDPGPAGGHVEAQYVGSQYGDGLNLPHLVVPASFVLSAGAFARLLREPDVRLSLEVKNLLDDETLQNGFAYPLPGRMFLVSLRIGSTSPGG
jgi:iron complex outermembrane receptor protein